MTDARTDEGTNNDSRPGAEIVELVLAHSYARPVVTELRRASTVAFPTRSVAFSPAAPGPRQLVAH